MAGTQMTAEVCWTAAERFDAHATSGHTIAIDAGAEKTASSPMELVLIGLCGCTASDVVNILTKKRQTFSVFRVTAVAERAPEPPRIFTSIHLTYQISSGVDRKAMDDAVRLSKEKYCSVSAMLQKVSRITASIEYV